MNTPNPDLLGDGLDWTTNGAYVLLLGSVLGLPADPVGGLGLPTHSPRPLPRLRAALAAVPSGPLLPALRRVYPSQTHSPVLALRHQARRGDQHCVACGAELDSLPASC